MAAERVTPLLADRCTFKDLRGKNELQQLCRPFDNLEMHSPSRLGYVRHSLPK